MNRNPSMVFIGGGNMARALIGGLRRQGRGAEEFLVFDPSAEALARLAAETGAGGATAPDARVEKAELVVLAVKPQQMQVAAQALAPRLSGQLVLTIAAGIRIADLARWLGGYPRIVRAMPNTPALIGAGVSGLYAPPEVDASARALAQSVLEAGGSTLWLAREEDLDAVTAVSGSGPAYVFYFLEALQAAAVSLGLPPEAGRKLAYETFAGAVRLALDSPHDAATLRAQVTSKGGTTERALAVMNAAAVNEHIVEAVRAAAARAAELGDELGRSA